MIILLKILTIIEKKIVIHPSLFFENISAFINLIFVNYFFILKNFIYNFTLKNRIKNITIDNNMESNLFSAIFWKLLYLLNLALI